MFKKIFFTFAIVIFSGLFLSGCSLKKQNGALQINSTPEANVFLDGKLMGKTPFKQDNQPAGEVSVKLIPDTDQNLVSWEGKVKVNNGVLTSIERVLGPTQEQSSGQILTLEKTKAKEPSISVVSLPDGALVKLDGESKGFTPLTLEAISEGEHEIVVSKDGYQEKTLSFKAIPNYQVIVNVQLAQLITATPTPTPSSGTPSSTSSGQFTGTKVLIKDTPTGWLRVRKEPSTSAEELTKVNPGEEYPLLEEKSGWYKIEYSPGKEGWISASYAQKK